MVWILCFNGSLAERRQSKSRGVEAEDEDKELKRYYREINLRNLTE
jgi:hypothetical protein